jgi:Uncharacterized conserved protein
MSTLFLAFIAMIGLSTTPITTKSIDVSKSQVEWVGKKVTGKHGGTITLKEGSLEYDGDQVVGGSFVIDMTSLQVTDQLPEGPKAKLTGHLKSADFFDVANHPTASFKIQSINDGSVYGHLTIKGITKPISFDANFTSAGAAATITVDRTKFDVRYGSGSFFDNLGDKAIYDEFTLNVNLAI